MYKQQLRPQQIARQLARELRNNPTEAEKVLWEKLRNRRFMGYKFLFQHPVFYKNDNRVKFFIADFYCHKLHLIVEVDGGVHESQHEYDIVRTEFLNAKNINVIRIKNEEVFSNINRSLIYIKKQISSIVPLLNQGDGRG